VRGLDSEIVVTRECPVCGHQRPAFAEFEDSPPLQRCAIIWCAILCEECGAIGPRATNILTARIAWNNRS
jgi:hypothetical protein